MIMKEQVYLRRHLTEGLGCSKRSMIPNTRQSGEIRPDVIFKMASSALEIEPKLVDVCQKHLVEVKMAKRMFNHD